MRADELRGKRVAIWGFGREGRAALRFLRAHDPSIALTVLEDATEATVDCPAPLIHGRAAIAAEIRNFDVVVKSPGISLYDPVVSQARDAGVQVQFAAQPLVCGPAGRTNDLRYGDQGQKYTPRR